MPQRLLTVLVAVAALLAGAALPALAADPDVPGLVDPATGRWYLRDAAGDTASFVYGNPGDVPFVGDWDCDGVDTPGLYRQADGFAYLRNSNTTGIADIRFFFGNPGDVPLAGDWDGDGCDTLSIYRPSESRIYVINRLGENDGGLGNADFSFLFGNPGDAPFVADFDADGDDEVGLRRESTGFAYLRFSLTTGIAERRFFYGDPGDKVIAGDWDGDGQGTVGIYRGAARRFFLRNANLPGFADLEHSAGDCDWLPVAGDFGNLAPDPGPHLHTVVEGLDFPLFLDAPPADPRLFVVERTGAIRIVENCALVAAPFLDIGGKLSQAGEGGLLGMAFHPNYAANGRFFVSYTRADGDSVVSEYRVSANPNRADTGSERVLLRVSQPSSNHNGGMLEFDRDGYLLVGFGDGGHGSEDAAQNVNNLLGSILRLDVDGAFPYAIPPGNPFAAGGGRPEILAYGARNPWRFSTDPATGTLLIGDVGQDNWEEIDALAPAGGGPLPAAAGANLGWPTMEGAHCFPAGSACSTAGLVLPVHEYAHPGGCSVTGGYTYRGTAMPSLDGTYLYGDFCAGWVRSFKLAAGATTAHRELFQGVGRITSFGTDGFGEVYVITASGRVKQVVPAG